MTWPSCIRKPWRRFAPVMATILVGQFPGVDFSQAEPPSAAARVDQGQVEEPKAAPELETALQAELVRRIQEAQKLREQGKLEAAFAAGEGALAIVQHLFGEQSAETIDTLIFLADCREQQKAWKASRALHEEIVRRTTALYGVTDTRAIDARQSLADAILFESLTAEQHAGLDEAHRLIEEVSRLSDQQRYREAIQLTIAARAKYLRVLGEEHWRLIGIAAFLADLYSHEGDYGNAEPSHRETLDRVRKVYGERHPLFALSLNNAGFMYEAMGDYLRAAEFHKRALAIREEILDDTDPDLAGSLSNLAMVYLRTRDFAQAVQLFQRALAIDEARLPQTNIAYADTLSNLGLLYLATQDQARAEPLIKQAMVIRLKELGESHPSFANSLHNLANLYAATGEADAAETLYLQALEIVRKHLGEMHPNLPAVLSSLAQFYDLKGDFTRASPFFEEALRLTDRHLELASVAQNERQQLAMSAAARHRLDGYLCCAVRSAKYTDAVYAHQLS